MPIARPTRRAVLDPAKTHVVLTASGPHHVQLLHGLTTCVAAAHGNVVETRAVQLGGDFTLLSASRGRLRRSNVVTKEMKPNALLTHTHTTQC